MKRFIAFSLMLFFAFAFTSVRATDTSPGIQKFSIEKTTLQTTPAIEAVQANVPEVPLLIAADPALKSSLCQTNFIPMAVHSDNHFDPGLIHQSDITSLKRNQIQRFGKSYLIPFVRDRS